MHSYITLNLTVIWTHKTEIYSYFIRLQTLVSC